MHIRFFKTLFELDQMGRDDNLISSEQLKLNDYKRRELLQNLLEIFKSIEAVDYYYIAMLYHHGVKLDHYKLAKYYAQKGIDFGCEKSKWLYAAAIDRSLMFQQKPQHYGTQFKFIQEKLYLVEYSLEITDSQRVDLNVPEIEKAINRAEGRIFYYNSQK